MNADKQFNEALKTCNNMDQVLDVVQKYYALNRQFDIVTKILVIAGIKKILDVVKAEPRTTIIK